MRRQDFYFRSGQCFLGLVLVVSAALHLSNPYRFLDSLLSYRFVWGTIAEFVALVLPCLQLVVGSALVTGVFRKGALILAMTMFLVFEAAQASAFFRGLEIDCGCFGDLGGLVSARSLFFTALLLAMSVCMVFVEFRCPNGLHDDPPGNLAASNFVTPLLCNRKEQE